MLALPALIAAATFANPSADSEAPICKIVECSERQSAAIANARADLAKETAEYNEAKKQYQRANSRHVELDKEVTKQIHFTMKSELRDVIFAKRNLVYITQTSLTPEQKAKISEFSQRYGKHVAYNAVRAKTKTTRTRKKVREMRKERRSAGMARR